jgi:imidazoleglycerol-phosphate dehydratase
MIREAKVSRKTKETDIAVDLYLDGMGRSTVEVDNQFLRHMLETLAKYSSFDLQLSGKGDNEHHLVEDVAIALGAALRQALRERPVERVASAMIPMDDALVTVALDIIDRPYADVDCPDPLYLHFFRSFAMSSGITLHIVVERGFDEHHIIEASFKAVGMALKRAVVLRADVLSTKDAVKFRRG